MLAKIKSLIKNSQKSIENSSNPQDLPIQKISEKNIQITEKINTKIPENPKNIDSPSKINPKSQRKSLSAEKIIEKYTPKLSKINEETEIHDTNRTNANNQAKRVCCIIF